MKHLLPRVPRYFKTNLHTHTTISDGRQTPREAKDIYKAKGYQILCLTDHNVIVDHSDMNEPDFLMLTGVGDVFPFMRVHSLLEALQPHFDDIPILVMYPGTFDGNSLRLFNTLTPNSYYRAFNEI